MKRIATVSTAALDEAVAAVRASAGQADLVEVRLDALWPSAPDADQATDALLALTDAGRDASLPLLATLRPKRQGGAFEGDEAVRVGLLMAAAKSGFDAVDVEVDCQDPAAVVRALHEDAPTVMLSDHRFSAAPSKDDGLMRLQGMQDAGADLQKLAYPAGAFPDLLRALELNHTFAQVQGQPAAMPIGFGGALGRALLPLAGAQAVYGHAPGVKPAVSGQPGIADVNAVLAQWGLNEADLAGPRSQWIAVVGNPVDHSLSPRIHNAALRQAGRPERYGALTVPDSMGAVRLLFGVANRIGMVGAGVTAPLKVHALAASQPDEAAQKVGAANTVRFRGNAIESTNTDVVGLRRFLEDGPDGPVLVLGAGGAARAAIHAAQLLDRPVTFTSRDEARAKEVLSQLGGSWVPWENRDASQAASIIQCTTVGSNPDDPSPLVDLGAAELVIEMVYAGGPTALERQAKAAGLTVHDGVDCLLNQAADQYRFWTDEEPDEAAMRRAVA